jgi:hypothetical protein
MKGRNVGISKFALRDTDSFKIFILEVRYYYYISKIEDLLSIATSLSKDNPFSF